MSETSEQDHESRICGSQGVDEDGRCLRCGLEPPGDGVTECPPGFFEPPEGPIEPSKVLMFLACCLVAWERGNPLPSEAGFLPKHWARLVREVDRKVVRRADGGVPDHEAREERALRETLMEALRLIADDHRHGIVRYLRSRGLSCDDDDPRAVLYRRVASAALAHGIVHHAPCSVPGCDHEEPCPHCGGSEPSEPMRGDDVRERIAENVLEAQTEYAGPHETADRILNLLRTPRGEEIDADTLAHLDRAIDALEMYSVTDTDEETTEAMRRIRTLLRVARRGEGGEGKRRRACYDLDCASCSGEGCQCDCHLSPEEREY